MILLASGYPVSATNVTNRVPECEQDHFQAYVASRYTVDPQMGLSSLGPVAAFLDLRALSRALSRQPAGTVPRAGCRRTGT